MNEVKVSVVCSVYNHEKYLRQCLDSMVEQQTNFEFEILVHDDASTDSSQQIICEYEKRYPHLIKPILQKENLYSKGVSIFLTVIFPRVKGKYVAFCEGDDRWCDPLKLQKQFDYMEENKDASMCVHSTILHDLSGKNPDRIFNDSPDHTLTAKEVLVDRKVHYSSFFIRTEYSRKPEYGMKYWAGDYVILTNAFKYGNIGFLSDVMSIHNLNNPVGAFKKYKNMDYDTKCKKDGYGISYLEKYNEETGYRFDIFIQERINQIKFELKYILLNNKFMATKSYKELKKIAKEYEANPYYKIYIKELPIGIRLCSRLKWQGYRMGYVWYVLVMILKRLGLI